MNDKGLKQSSVAKKAGFKEQSFSLLMTERKVFRAEYVLPIAVALGVTPNDLFAEYKDSA
jgi:DNA-binding Xre family transcriptional regulator